MSRPDGTDRLARPDGTDRPVRPGSATRSARPRGGDALRLFVALDLPDDARAALVAFRDAAADGAVWRLVAPEAIHLTLAFLGHRPRDEVDRIGGVLREATGPAPRLALAGALLLPPRRARVLCAEVADPDGTLAELQSRVSDGLAAAGAYEPETRPFRAHVTVARLRAGQHAPRAVPGDPEPLEFSGGPLTLYVSRLHPKGARYEPLSRVSLH
jgi:RNA 2',3'-cyclic 3'-phosphodiesterase